MNTSIKSSAGQKGNVILIVLLIATLIGGYFVYTNYKLPIFDRTNNRTKVSLSTPAPTSDPTANWKVYTSIDYGYTFKYPSDLNLIDYQEKPYNRIGVQLNTCPQKGTDAFCGYNLHVSISVNNQTNSPRISVDQAVNQQRESNKEVCLPQTKYSDVTPTTIAGKPAKTYSISVCYGNSKAFFVSDGNNVFVISQGYSDNEAELKYKQLNDQILSTFQFAQ